jgi:hypothetical protein
MIIERNQIAAHRRSSRKGHQTTEITGEAKVLEGSLEQLSKKSPSQTINLQVSLKVLKYIKRKNVN